MDKWSFAFQFEFDAKLEKSIAFTYHFQAPQEWFITIHDLIYGKVYKLSHITLYLSNFF